MLQRKQPSQKPFDNLVLHTGDELVLPHVVNFARFQLRMSDRWQKQQVPPCTKRRNTASICLVVSSRMPHQTLVDAIHVLVPPQILAVHGEAVFAHVVIVAIQLAVMLE